MTEPTSVVAEQFEDAPQQHEAVTLGMWTFLATEILFFGGLFMGYLVYRHAYYEAFATASQHTDVFYGTLNTAILLTSSLTMALAVHAAQTAKKTVARWLGVTLGLAIGFMVVKGFEYHKDFAEHLVPGPGFNPELPARADLFFWLYYAMTGLHAIHVLVGIGIIAVIAWRSFRGKLSNPNQVEMTGLYWHFVDLVWIFLYPLLYLIDRHS